jgi:hypothetical protein
LPAIRAALPAPIVPLRERKRDETCMRLLSVLIATVALTGPALADWQLQCSPEKCRAFTYSDRDVLLQGRIRYLVEFTDRAEFRLSALVNRDQYQRDFTSNPPTSETFDGQDYVAVPIFGQELRARIRVDGELIATTRPGPKGTISLSPGEAESLIERVKHRRQLQVEFRVGSERHGPTPSFEQGYDVLFDLTGLQDALSKFRRLTIGTLPAAPNTKPPIVEAGGVETVVLLLDGANRHGVQRSDLAAVPNPRGSGTFVYVKDRKGFIWFVFDGDVVAVSAWAKNVTPDALDPYEVTPGFWMGMGLDADSVFRVGENAANHR